jgi:hypothetical protein
MKTQANFRSTNRATAPCWLPASPSRSVDLSHWQSRAARGHTWNADAATRRRRTH